VSSQRRNASCMTSSASATDPSIRYERNFPTQSKA
jgi:hypothetical protein